jgi:hypothetical protein
VSRLAQTDITKSKKWPAHTLIAGSYCCQSMCDDVDSAIRSAQHLCDLRDRTAAPRL